MEEEKQKFVDIENTRTPEMREKWQRITDSGEDPFDPKNFKKWVEGKIILASEHWYVFQNNYPYPETKYQFVIVSKKFYTNIIEIPSDEWVDLQSITKKLITGYKIPGGGFSMRFGDTKLSGGSVMHIHAQLTVPEDGKRVPVWLGSERK